jgi:hypothetical protein
MVRLLILLAAGLALAGRAATVPGQEAYAQGSREYAAGQYEPAAASFGQAVESAPSAGAWQNLGNAEWQCGQTGPAILAWERAQWLDPLSPNSRGNLRFARKARLLEAPDLVWYEICSTWLPVNAWPWIASLSLWLAVGMVMLPGVFRWRRAGWHQAVAAAGFAVFLLTLPAMVGIHTRTKIGVVLARETPLRLTPTSEAQTVARLAAGEIARLERERGHYLFVRTGTTTGWIDRAQFGLIARLQKD